MAQSAPGLHPAMHPLITRRSLLLVPLSTFAAPKPEVWRFERLPRLGPHATRIEGSPQIINSPLGKAIEFNGADAIFLETNPLAGATAFTWECVFKPYASGRPEQRFFHLTENNSDHRLLLETRLIEGRWCLDAYVACATGKQTLIDRTRLHRLDAWHHVSFGCDGQQVRHWVNGQLEFSAPLQFSPLGPGKCSIGVRYNRIDYFKGAIRQAIFHRQAIDPQKFTIPPGIGD